MLGHVPEILLRVRLCISNGVFLVLDSYKYGSSKAGTLNGKIKWRLYEADNERREESVKNNWAFTIFEES